MTTSDPSTSATRPRPGGRSARVRYAVHRAVTELLAEDAAETLTIPVIAARAGVHATTVYRRWGSVPELLGDIASSRFSGEVVVPDTGSLRGEVVRGGAQDATDLADPDVLKLMRAAVGTGPLGCEACVADRHAQLTAILDRERARGGDPPELERTADLLLGPLYYRAVFIDRPAGPDWARDLVAGLLG
ncbi:TetR-like C-terminal domain-containing protein [Streptomyces millisiae]|uniref:TetR-like C-terminal domain-containing protein n=1 Tax=Streptomyces millisiae TaxID=3075542 RepID=A0ABU2LI60_9ACTN|nr:TetR-like C-terminal domain-containing protein [Streptomyces sp. DSM 44918]MDT0317276.1 TetR-like C-terminal domain-containing protein [Streptomyces sp. DSM 44918]